MSPSLINLGALPGYDMEPETIRSGAVRLEAAGSEVGTTSAGVVKTWHRLDDVYDAPESGLLLAAMDPVKASGATVSEHFAAAAAALNTFAGEVETIKQAVAAIQADALAFFASIPGGKSTVTVHDTRNGDTAKQVDWWDDPAAASKNNALHDRVTAQAQLLSAAEDRCHSTLMGLAEGTFQGTENGGPGYYTGPPAWVENAPWGEPVRIPELFEDPVGKAVKRHALETLANLAPFAGWDTSGYHYDLDKTAAEQGPMFTSPWSWRELIRSRVDLDKSLWTLATNFKTDPQHLLTGLALLAGAAMSGRPVQGADKHPWAGLIGSTVAIQDWKDHPWSAATELGINVGSAVLGGPELNAAKGTGDAVRVAREAEISGHVAADTERTAEVTRVAKLAKESGTASRTLPTVDGLKAIDAGTHLDTAWARDLDKLDVDIKVPDHSVNIDRPNVPHERTGAPAVADAPAPRPVSPHVHPAEPAKVPAADEHPARRVRDEADVPARGRDLVEVGATAEHRAPGAGEGAGEGAKVTSDRPVVSDGSTGGRGGADTAGPRAVPERQLVHAGAPERPLTLDRPTAGHGGGSAGTDAPRGTGSNGGDGGTSPLNDPSAGHDRLPDDHGPSDAPGDGSNADHPRPDSTPSGPAPEAHPKEPLAVPDRYSDLKTHRLDSGDKGAWNKLLHKPQADSVYVIDDRHVLVTDHEARVTHVETQLHLEDGARNQYQQRVAGREFRLEIDQGGHLIGARFGGPGEGINLVPMAKELNQAGKGTWYEMESQWADILKEDPNTNLRVRMDITYDDVSKRPSEFGVRYSVNGGRPVERVFEQ